MTDTGVLIRRNIQELGASLVENLKYIDLSFKGPVDGDISKFVVKNGSAVLNQYKMWLLSDRYNYLRKPNFGGFLENNLNRYPFLPSSESLIDSELRTKTAEEFPYIEILKLTVKCDQVHRCWILKVAVRDKITGLIGNMYDNGIVLKV